jgi:hypothetical protein
MGVGSQVPGAGKEQMTAGAGCYRYPPATAGGTDKIPATAGGTDKTPATAGGTDKTPATYSRPRAASALAPGTHFVAYTHLKSAIMREEIRVAAGRPPPLGSPAC